VLVAMAPTFAVLMLGRAILGITIGGFWSMATAVLMRLVLPDRVSAALAVMYAGQACAAAFAAPIGSYLGGIIGWRGVFWVLVPIVAANLLWQITALPSLPVYNQQSARNLIALLRRAYFARGLAAATFTFAGAFAMFTYLRPFLENVTGLGVRGLSLMLLVLGCAGFLGTWIGGRMASRHATRLIIAVPLAMLLATLGLVLFGHFIPLVALFLAVWGVMNTIMSVSWMAWVAQNTPDATEAAGSLIVATIQAAILCGAAFGGWMLDHIGIEGTFLGSAALSALSLLVIGSGRGLRRQV
jgi:predicted MFS family arabinose efflux permease